MGDDDGGNWMWVMGSPCDVVAVWTTTAAVNGAEDAAL
jgi:hypothetical protein